MPRSSQPDFWASDSGSLFRITANSSPPRRATSSTLRVIFVRTFAIAVNNRSPAGCPNVSLVALKPSRSISSRTAGSSYQCPRATARSSASTKPLRFRRPVFSSVIDNVRRWSISAYCFAAYRLAFRAITRACSSMRRNALVLSVPRSKLNGTILLLRRLRADGRLMLAL